MPKSVRESIIKDKESLVRALNDGDFMVAAEKISRSYRRFMTQIDLAVLDEREIDLRQFSQELREVFEEIDTKAKPFFLSAMKSVINIKDAHRQGCVAAVQSILSTFGELKKHEIHESTTLGKLPEIRDIAAQLYSTEITDDTTIGELYQKRTEMIKNARGTVLEKVVGVVKDKFSHHPTDHDYKEFVRYMINLKALEGIKSSITEKVGEQQRVALENGIPVGYDKAIHSEVVDSNQYALTKAAKAVGGKVFGESVDPRQDLVQSLNTDLASMTMSMDLAAHGFTEKQLESIDKMQNKVARTKEKRGNAATIYDMIDYIFQELKSVFTHIFGNESAKIVDGVKEDFRKEMRKNIRHNIGENLEKDFKYLGSVCERVKNAVEYQVQKPESTAFRDKHSGPEKVEKMTKDSSAISA